MAIPGASPLADLQAAYASVCANIRDFAANPRPNYTVGGVSLSRSEYAAMLKEQEKTLREIPGVAPETNPLISIDEYL